jgi:hypothetical protein
MQLEPDNSEDIICASIIDYYLQRPANIEHICLAELASSYTKKGKKRRHGDMPYVIRYVRYSEHKGVENFYREHLMLYVPYRVNENIFQKQYSTWRNAYMSLKETIKKMNKISHIKQLKHGVTLMMHQACLKLEIIKCSIEM